MAPTKDESGLDHTQYPNCNIHFVASSLPEELPTLDEIEQRFSGRPETYNIKTMQMNENSNYIVKRDISLVMEGWTMLYLKKMTRIPTPTVYAILTDKPANRDIIIMEYIPNQSLEKTWQTLKDAEKEDTANQLAAYFAELRALPPPGFFGRSLPPEFGNLGKQPLTDTLFGVIGEGAEFGGPFDTVEQLRKGLGDAVKHNSSLELERRKFYDRIIPRILSESPPVFTHGDLQLRNIIRKDNGQVVIIDWGCWGWYPAWWEYCVAAWSADYKTDWPAYIPKFLPEFPSELCLFFILRTLWLGSII